MSGAPALSRATVDRAAHRRADAEWLSSAYAGGRVLVLDGDRALVVDGDTGPRLLLVDAASAPDGTRFFLGEDDGAAYFAVAGDGAGSAFGLRTDARPLGLREVGALLDDRDAGLLVQAVALANWHATHTRCPRCGAPTEPARGGHVRVCTDDGSEHFPRTDPAVIMLVHDGADRCLLGRQPSWPPGRYSCLAGFVEPGESAEMAVAREVLEESGVVVRDVRYVGSQPWPFPSSLMLGYTARADGDAPVVVDHTELDDAQWFSRDDLRARRVLFPPPVSIAYRLITSWLDSPVA